jgi:hypothetical protein
MEITIRQSAGFGDIFFCQKIGKRLVELGHKVYWPIIPEYQYAEKYMNADFVWSEPGHPTTELPLEIATHNLIWRSAEEALDNIMQAKYKLANTTFDIGGWNDWQNYLKIKRDKEREIDLFDLLSIDTGEPYCVTCRHFATNYLNLNIPINSDIHEIEIRKIPGFTLFDWCGILEEASEIRIPDSSFPYLIEILDTTDRLFMYNRNGEPHIRTKPIWRKKWTFVE